MECFNEAIYNNNSDDISSGSSANSTKCKPITIPDSDHSFEPLIDSNNEITIKCNEGYSFNHNLLHNSGKVKCKTDINDNLPTSLNWYVHDVSLERKCATLSDKDICEGTNGNPTPTYSPNDIYNNIQYLKDNLYDLEYDRLQGSEPFRLHCKWDNSNPIPTCKFRVKVDNRNTQEPLCKPQYCPEKAIPNSSRDGVKGNPLPGPRLGSNVGECINNDDGTIYPQITNVQDCLCHKYNSCNICSNDTNCKWCGSDSDTGNPGCYGINSPYALCDENSIIMPGGGSCTDIEGVDNPEWGILNIIDQTLDQCENEKKCINILDNTEIPEAGPSTKLNLRDMQQKYESNGGPINLPSLKSAELCNSYNNTYYPDIYDKEITSVETPDNYVCYLKKNISDTYTDYTGLPFGIITESNNNYISIQPNICVPTDSTDSNDITCYGNITEQSCPTENCRWEPNKFDNNIVYWADQKEDLIGSGDKINFFAKQESQGYTCPSGPIEVKEIFPGYIKLLNTQVTPSDALNCNIQYINTSDYSRNNRYNTSDMFHTSRYDEYSPPYTCLGTKNDGMCQPLSGQENYTYPADLANPLYVGFYSAFKNSLSYGNITEDTCVITGHTIVGEVEKYDSLSPMNYAICDIAEQDELIQNTQCNHLNKTITVDNKTIDTVHWGEMCKKTDNTYRSLKNLCEIGNETGTETGTEYEWIKDWNGGGKCVTTDNQTNVNCHSFTNFTKSGSDKKCIIETPTSINELNTKNICENWKVEGTIPTLNNVIDFKYEQIEAEEIQDHCDPGYSFYIPGVNSSESNSYINKNNTNCIVNNLDYINKYNFSNVGFCKPDQISFISSKDLRWTGGDLTSDNDGTWKKDCNASILGSCYVDCDTGYGGGGEYSCHYNNDSKDVCKHIEANFCNDTTNKLKNCLPPGSRESECNKYPSCYYTAPTDDKTESCSVINVNNINSGQPEWIGPRCYPLNNKAFAHGIYDIPLLNEVFPPLSRLIVFFIIVIILLFIMYKLKIFKALLILFKKISFTSLRTTTRGFLVLLRDSTYGFIYVVNPQNYPNHANFISKHHKKIIFVTGISTVASIFYNWDVLSRKMFE
jgi:hypothetical protein